MSSDDSGDSGFDKEAEREKLREKYEQDEKDRENTRRMSELLLQGATMTGKHCGECGDPIFRYDGQEFCPTCQQAAESGEARQGGSQQNTGQQAAGQRNPDQQGADEQTPDRTGQSTETAGEDAADPADESADSDEPRVEINDVRVADRHADRSNVRQPPSQQGSGATDRRGGDANGREADARRYGREGDARRRGGESGDGRRGVDARRHAHARDVGDLGEARDALVRKLTDLARRAEETDDVARSRELLAATREAAEALAALDGADR